MFGNLPTILIQKVQTIQKSFYHSSDAKLYYMIRSWLW